MKKNARKSKKLEKVVTTYPFGCLGICNTLIDKLLFFDFKG